MIYRLPSQDTSVTGTLGTAALTMAAAPQQNNLIVTAFTSDGTIANTTTPAGYTSATQGNFNTTFSLHIAYKVAAAGESATITWTNTIATVSYAQAYEFPGINFLTTALAKDTNIAGNAAAGAVTNNSGAVTTTYDYELLFAAVATHVNVTNIAFTNAGSQTWPWTLLQTQARLGCAFALQNVQQSENAKATWTTAAAARTAMSTFRGSASLLPSGGAG